MHSDTRSLPSVDALHASLLKLMSNYAKEASSKNAQAVVTVLRVLAWHPERRRLSEAHDVYKDSLRLWTCIANDKWLTEATIEDTNHMLQ